jgi:hypothetical protein
VKQRAAGARPRRKDGRLVQNRDVEFLNLRKYQVNDIRPHLRRAAYDAGLRLRDLQQYRNLSVGFVTFCLSPWFHRWRQPLSRDLIRAKCAPFTSNEFHCETLVVSEVLQRFQAWNAAIVSGSVNRNEVREREGFHPGSTLSSGRSTCGPSARRHRWSSRRQSAGKGAPARGGRGEFVARRLPRSRDGARE